MKKLIALFALIFLFFTCNAYAGFLRADSGVTVNVGPFMNATDGVTPETGITLAAADQAELLKPGGVATTDLSGSTWIAITGCDGWYHLGLTAGNLDTEGTITIVVQDSSVCVPVFMDFTVINANAYDSLYGTAGTDLLQVDITQQGGETATSGVTTVRNADIIAILVDTNDLQTNQGNWVTATNFSTHSAEDVKNLIDSGVTLANVAHGGAAATLTLSDYSNFWATGFSTHAAADVKNLIDSGVTVTTMGANVITAASIATDAITSDELAQSGVSEIWSTTLNEPKAGAPPAAPTGEQAVMYPYTTWRNKDETLASGVSVYADDGSTIIFKMEHSDDGTTYTSGEWGAP